jgi:hypothetical protein
MDLEQAIHQRWASSGKLSSLLPVDRVRTGLARDLGIPYATLTRKPGRTILRTNAGDALDEIPIVIQLWHDQFDAGQAIAREVKAALDRSQFALADGDRVIDMRRSGESVVERGDGTWQWAIEFSVQVYLTAGH